MRHVELDIRPFKLSEIFLESYKTKIPNFGFNGLGEFVFYRTYSRIKENGTKEEWWEVCQRVIEWVFTKQKEWINHYNLGWNNAKSQKTAKEMYDRMFEFKWLPPGRGLWAAGTAITEERKLYAALNNCSFVSTQNLREDLSKPFEFLMDMSMLGVGVGFDVLGAGQVNIKDPNKNEIEIFQIEDSREGWVSSLQMLLDSYFLKGNKIEFDYSLIRQAGSPIKGFGGISSGYKPLQDMHKSIRKILNSNINKEISETNIVDIMNIIGVAVVAGNLRRTAEIAFGSSNEFINLKNYEKNPERQQWGWASNNSIIGEIGQDYSEIASRIAKNAEPGIFWLSNAQKYSRMGEETWADRKALGGNPSLRKGTRVLTTNGIFPINELENKEFFIVTPENNIVSSFCRLSGKNKHLWKIELEGGHEYYCTEEHKWPILQKNGLYSKKHTKDIESGDYIKLGNKIEKLFDGDDATYDEGFLFGYTFGDGWITKRSDNGKYQIGITITQDDYNNGVKDKLLSQLQKYGFKGNFHSHHKDSINDFEINTSRKSIVDKFIEKGFINKKNGLPKYLFSTASEDFRKGFVDGLMSSDGHVKENGGRVGFSTSIKKVANDFSELLGFYGIKTSNSYRKRKNISFPNGKKYDREYESYQVRIGEHNSLEHFKKIFSFTNSKKNKRLLKKHTINLKQSKSSIKNNIKIKSVKQTKISENVWDIAVDDKAHVFRLAHSMTSNCLEQTLESYEVCCLVSTFPTKHEDLDDYKRTLKYAYMYAKTVTLCETHWPDTNKVMLRNRRIGTSIGGVAEFLDSRGIDTLRKWADEGYEIIQHYDEVYSDWFAVPKSIKTTSIKPDGSVSLLAGVSPGIHFPESRFYIRRVRLSKNSNYVELLKNAGYNIELAEYQEDTFVVEFPVKFETKVRSVRDVSMWEQLELASFLQEHWADNQISCTVTFNKQEALQIEHALDMYQYKLKGVSMLPLLENGAYAQMPYEKISEEEFEKMSEPLKKIDWKNSVVLEDAEQEKYCTNDTCII